MYRNEYSFTWKIENFLFWNKRKGQFLDSPCFTVKILDGTEYFLRLYPRGQNGKFISCFLCAKDAVSNHSEFDFEIEISGISGTVLQRFKWPGALEQIDSASSSFLPIKDTVFSDGHSLTVCCRIFAPSSQETESVGCIARTKIGVDRRSFECLAPVQRGKLTMEHTISFKPQKSFKLSIPEADDNFRIIISKLEYGMKQEYFVDCTVTLLNAKRHEGCSERGTYYFHQNPSTSVWEFPVPILAKELDKNLDNYLVKIKGNEFACFHCELSCSNGMETVFISSETEYDPFPICSTLKEDLRNLFYSKENSDMKFRVDNKFIDAHKSILVARSPVFAAMFAHKDMKEAQTSIHDTVDMDEDTLNTFLKFLYTDEVDEFDYENAKNLLLAAEKFQVLSLKKKCLMFLRTEIAVENVCEKLSLADIVNDAYLKKAAMNFIIENSEIVLASPHWLAWMNCDKNNAKLASTILLKLTLNQFIES